MGRSSSQIVLMAAILGVFSITPAVGSGFPFERFRLAETLDLSANGIQKSILGLFQNAKGIVVLACAGRKQITIIADPGGTNATNNVVEKLRCRVLRFPPKFTLSVRHTGEGAGATTASIWVFDES